MRDLIFIQSCIFFMTLILVTETVAWYLAIFFLPLYVIYVIWELRDYNEWIKNKMPLADRIYPKYVSGY